MSAVITGPGYRNAFRLKELLGRDRAQLLQTGRHPLGLGFASIDAWLAKGRRLSDVEREQAADVELFAKELFELEEDWREHKDTLRRHILKASECAAIRFELHVATFSLRPSTSHVTWTRYRDGLGDFQTFPPEITIECKLVRSDDLASADRLDVRNSILKKIRDTKSQVRPSTPYVIAIGFEEILDSEVDLVMDAILRSDQWFGEHPEVSALLVFSPQKPIRERVRILGMSGRFTHYGAVTQVTHNGASRPLPGGLLFRTDGPFNEMALRQIDRLGRKGTERSTQVIPIRTSAQKVERK